MNKIPLLRISEDKQYNLNAVRWFDFENGECYIWFDQNTNVKITNPSDIAKIKSFVEVL